MASSVIVWGSAAVGALLVGIMIGLAFGRRPGRADSADWKVRMAARDRDLAEAVNRVAEAEIELQALRERVGGLSVRDPESEAQIVALTEELSSADDELTRLRSLGVDKAPAASTALASRLEALEVELATLASMRCPDPSAHRGSANRLGRARSLEPDDEDDLTRITGVGPGLASIFRSMGYRTFADIARMTDDDLEKIAAVAGSVAGPSAREGWVQSARRLASNDAA